MLLQFDPLFRDPVTRGSNLGRNYLKLQINGLDELAATVGEDGRQLAELSATCAPSELYW
jgi:hypothetical protein